MSSLYSSYDLEVKVNALFLRVFAQACCMHIYFQNTLLRTNDNSACSS